MPKLNVTRVLFDPRFMTRDLVCRRTAVVTGNNGRSQKSITSTPFSGVVTTNSGMNMDRRPDGALIKGAINIHTKFVLIAGDSGNQADEVVWQGKTYIVSQVLSNTQYGAGFVKAICELKPLSG